MEKLIIDFNSCPHCGSPETDGCFCSLECRSAFDASPIKAQVVRFLHDLNVANARAAQATATIAFAMRASLATSYNQ